MWEISRPPANGASLDRFLARGTGPTEHQPKKKKNWDILFCPTGPKNFFGPIPWQADEIIGGLLATESQSCRVTESQTTKGTQYTGG